MTVICFGERCKEQIVPSLDTVSLIREKGKQQGVSEERRSESDQKREDLLSKVSRTSNAASLLGPFSKRC
jgi:hypothetical protein